MESILLKYSQLILDDGAIDQAKKDFADFGDFLVGEAKRIKKEFRNNLDLGDDESVKAYEKQVEQLTDAFKKHSKATADLDKIQAEYNKTAEEAASSNDDQLKKLVALDKQLLKYRTDLAQANKFIKEGVDDGRDLNEVRVEAQINIKKINEEIRKQQKVIIDSNKLSKEEEKLLKARLTLQKEEIRNRTELRERIAALRVVVDSLDFETEADQIAAFNEEIDELTEKLSENSDKFIQNKINIGNYEESIVNALSGTEAFTTGIGGLDAALAGILALMVLNDEQLDELEKSLGKNGSAVKKLAVRFGRLNKVLKASIIGVVLVAVAALGSAFGDTRAGAIRLQKVMQTLQTVFISFGNVAEKLAPAIGQLFVVLTQALTNPFKLREGLKKLKEDFAEAWEAIKNGFDTGGDAIIAGLENIVRQFQIQDTISRLAREIAILTGEYERLQDIAGDSTVSLREQLEASELALERAREISKLNITSAKLELELINEKLKQNIKANGEEVKNINLNKTGVDFADAVLKLAEQRGAQLKISNSLIEEQQDAVIAVLEAENELNAVTRENQKIRREIQRDLFEQNLDLLIDLIDTEKSLSEQAANDTNRNFRRRVEEFNNFLVRFRENANRELDEFNKQASSRDLDVDLSIEYQPDGSFRLFNNDSELAIDNIVKLNEQLQATGLNEIEINRFREFVKETGAAVKDFIDLNESLRQVGIKVAQLRRDLIVDRQEIEGLAELNEEIRKLSEINLGGVSSAERRRILGEIKSLEDERTEIQKEADKDRTKNRIDAINRELSQTRKIVEDGVTKEVKVIEDGSDKQLELFRERESLQKSLLDDSIQDRLDAIKEEAKKQEKIAKENAAFVRRTISALLDAFVEAQDKRIESVENRIDRQETIIDIQRRRAEQGLENTLAFEQKELAKNEAERIRQEKRKERIQKVQALYSSYNNYAQRNDQNAIVKALRDFAILESIAASFGDGGIVGAEKVRTNSHGVTIGRSHNMKGGIPAFHEGGEGFVSRKAMANIGEGGFRTFHKMAEHGHIDSNFFTQQKDSFITHSVAAFDNSRLESAIFDVKRAIENQPKSELDIKVVKDSTLALTSIVTRNNRKIRTTARIRKRRF